MTKKEYLYELACELNKYFKRSEVKSIMSDYLEYFETGLAEGKSEEELCESFGDVKTLVKEIAENQTDSNPTYYKIKGYITIISIAVITIFLLTFNTYNNFQRIVININKTFLNTIVIFSVIAVPFLILFLVKLYKKYRVNLNEYFFSGFFMIIFILGIVNWIRYDGLQFIKLLTDSLASINAEILGSSIAGNLELLKSTIIACIGFIVISALRKESKIKYADFFPVLFILVGIYQTICNIYIFLGNLSSVDLTILILGIFKTAIPLHLGIILALITLIISYFFKSHSDKGEI